MSTILEFAIAFGNMAMDLVRFHADPTIQADERDNFGNPIAEFPPLFVAKGGWDIGQGVAIVFPANEDEKARAVAQRKARIAEWQAMGDRGLKYIAYHNPDTTNADGTTTKGQSIELSYAELARFASVVWSNENGEILAPTRLHNSCIRRGYAAMASALALYHCNKLSPDKFVIGHTERVYAATPEGEHRKARERWDENLLLGRQPYSDADLLVLVRKSVAYFGSSEAEIIREFGFVPPKGSGLPNQRGKAQKLHKLAKLAINYPNLAIVERCKVKPEWDDTRKEWVRTTIKDGPAKGKEPILLSTIMPSEIAYMLGEHGGRDAKAPELAEASGAKEGVGATAEQVERYFGLLYRGRTNKPKALGENELKGIAETLLQPTNETARIVKVVITAIRDGNKLPIVALLRNAESLAESLAESQSQSAAQATGAPVVESPVVESPVVESPVVESPVVKASGKPTSKAHSGKRK